MIANFAIESKGRVCLRMNESEKDQGLLSCFKDLSKVLEMSLFSVLMRERLHLVNASHTQCASNVQS